MRFVTGPDPETDLTEAQVLGQCKMYIAALRIADEFGCDVDRHPVPAGAQGPGCRRRIWSRVCSTTWTARRSRTPATGTDAVRGPGAAALQRGGRVRRPGRAGHQPDLAQAGLRSRDHAARCPLRREVTGSTGKRSSSGCSRFPARCRPQHLIGGYAGAVERPAASHVLPPGRRNAEGHQQAGRDRLEPRVRGRTAR